MYVSIYDIRAVFQVTGSKAKYSEATPPSRQRHVSGPVAKARNTHTLCCYDISLGPSLL